MVTPESASEAELPQRMMAGEQQALAAFFTRHRDRLWNVVHFRLDPRLRRRVDPEDVLQQAYLDALQRLHHFQGDSEALAFVWVRWVVLQTLAETHRTHLGAQLRSADREVGPGGDNLHGTSFSLAQSLVGNLTSPSGAAWRAEKADLLEKALQGMDATDREVLALRHFEELTNTEVARVLDIQQKAASIRYVRALARLKEILSTIPGFSGSSHDS